MNKNLLTLIFVFTATVLFAKPLTFVTYHATSQYYPNMSASQIAAIVPYGGKLKVKVEPDVDSTHAKKKLKTANLLSEGDVQFGGTEETKGSLELKNVSGTAKSLETVDAYVQNLYLYNIQFPNTSNTMEWKPLTVKTSGGGTYSATFLTAGHTAPVETFKCTISEPIYCGHNNCSVADTYNGNNRDWNVGYNVWASYFEVLANKQPKTYYDVYVDNISCAYLDFCTAGYACGHLEGFKDQTDDHSKWVKSCNVAPSCYLQCEYGDDSCGNTREYRDLFKSLLSENMGNLYRTWEENKCCGLTMEDPIALVSELYKCTDWQVDYYYRKVECK